ncbi:VOC family protein [Pseudoalteromonas sp. YIC-656]|uniref:VOC family protein n=1 Tax=Pseudoalteromonas pernae TaxID=3118054 RepID=UPI00324244D1
MECVGTTIFVDNVEEVLDFYYQAFGIPTAYIDEQGTYGELDCGQGIIAFAAHAISQPHFRQGYIRCHPKQPTLGFELSFECDNVAQSFAKALEAGAEPLSPPTQHEGQFVAFLRAQEGTLIRLFSNKQSASPEKVF